jgi:hypothetical protein
MEPIPEENSNPSQASQASQEPQRIEISPLQLLVNAVFLGYQRGVYTMKEAGIISQAIDFFTVETKQAIIPVPSGQMDSNSTKSSEKTEKVIMQSQ